MNAFVAAYAAYPSDRKFPSIDVSKLNAQEKKAESVRLYRFMTGECVDPAIRPQRQFEVGLYSLDVKVADKRVTFRMVSGMHPTAMGNVTRIFVFDEAGAFLLAGQVFGNDPVYWDRPGSPASGPTRAIAEFRASKPVCR